MARAKLVADGFERYGHPVRSLSLLPGGRQTDLGYTATGELIVAAHQLNVDVHYRRGIKINGRNKRRMFT